MEVTTYNSIYNQGPKLKGILFSVLGVSVICWGEKGAFVTSRWCFMLGESFADMCENHVYISSSSQHIFEFLDYQHYKQVFRNVHVILLLAAGSTGGKTYRPPPPNNYLGVGVGFPNNYRQLILMFQGLLISTHMHQIISSQSSLTTWK